LLLDWFVLVCSFILEVFMSIFGPSYSATVTVDSNGKPTGLSDVVASSLFAGAIGGLISITNDTVYTGAAKTAGIIVPILVAVAGTSKITTGSFIPNSRRGSTVALPDAG